jgi:hypothetical protein
MKIYVDEDSLSPSSFLNLAKDKKSFSKITKILEKLDAYLVKKENVIDIYSKQGIYQITENKIYKMYIKSENSYDDIVFKKNDGKNITLLMDDSYIEKEPTNQIPYEHINVPITIHRYSLNKNSKFGINLLIEFIENTKPINYYFEYTYLENINLPVEDINVFLSLLN